MVVPVRGVVGDRRMRVYLEERFTSTMRIRREGLTDGEVYLD